MITFAEEKPKDKGIAFDEPAPAAAPNEFASNKTDILLNNFVFGGQPGSVVYPHPDQVLRLESRGMFYDLYEHMEDTDPHYFAVLDTRKNAILGKPWVIVPSERDPRGEEHAEFINIAFRMIPAFNEAMYEILDALGKGWKAVEIMWDTIPVTMNDGTQELRTIVKEMKGRPQRRFIFDMDGTLRLLKGIEQYTHGILLSSPQVMGDPMPDRKFIIAQFNKREDNPYGKGLAKKVYWYYWFKKSLIKYAMVHADKFGMPTAYGKYAPGTEQSKIDELLAMLRNIQQESEIAYPNNVEVGLLEAMRAGQSPYRDLMEFFDDSISKAVLGQTLTSSEGRRSGALALGEVHADVKQDILEKDAAWFEDILNNQLIRWMIDYNYFDVIDYPHIKFQVNRSENQETRSNVFSTLKNMGMDIAKHQVRDEFKLDEPTDPDDVLAGGFGAPGEIPFGSARNAAPAGGGPKAVAGQRPAQGQGEQQQNKAANFAETDDDPLDAVLPRAVGAGLNAMSPVKKAIAQSIRRRGL